MKLPDYKNIPPLPSKKAKDKPRLKETQEILNRMRQWKKDHGIKGNIEPITKPEFPPDRIEIH